MEMPATDFNGIRAMTEKYVEESTEYILGAIQSVGEDLL